AKRGQRHHRGRAHADENHLPENLGDTKKLAGKRRDEHPVEQTQIQAQIIFQHRGAPEWQDPPNDESRKSEPDWPLTELDEPPLAEVADVATAGALDHVDGELEQATFPSFVYALHDRAERFVAML